MIEVGINSLSYCSEVCFFLSFECFNCFGISESRNWLSYTIFSVVILIEVAIQGKSVILREWWYVCQKHILNKRKLIIQRTICFHVVIVDNRFRAGMVDQTARR